MRGKSLSRKWEGEAPAERFSTPHPAARPEAHDQEASSPPARGGPSRRAARREPRPPGLGGGPDHGPSTGSHAEPTSERAWPGCYTLDGWQLTPEGGAIHPGERTAVIADVHLGYEWARGEAGDCIPAHSLAEALESLERLLGRARIDRLIVAGDLVETPRPCRRTAADLARLGRWLNDREIALVALLGNHDRSLASMVLRNSGGREVGPPALAETIMVAGWTIAHGHRPIDGERSITGHHHPALRLAGRTTPCFLAAPGRIVLPAFSRNAAGCDLAAARLPGAWQGIPFRCLVSTGQEVLDFGPLDSLGVRIRASSHTG